MSFQATVTSDSGERGFIDLIERIAEGDQEALGMLYDSTSPLIFGLVLRIVGDRAAAEEVLLDVYKQIWRQAGLYDARRGQPMAWLLRIARSRALDRLRTFKREQQFKQSIAIEPVFSPSPINPEQNALISEQQKLVCGALAALPKAQRKVIELAYYSGLTHSEIAVKLGLPLGTIKTRTRLGLMKLRELLSPVMEAQL